MNLVIYDVVDAQRERRQKKVTKKRTKEREKNKRREEQKERRRKERILEDSRSRTYSSTVLGVDAEYMVGLVS